MASGGTDLGWWGRHPYFYVTFTTSIALVYWVALLLTALAAPSALLAVALCPGVVGVPMTFASVFAWHHLLVDRHRDERQRWNWDRPVVGVVRVLLWVGFAVMLAVTVTAGWDAWRFDHHGRIAEAVVTRVETNAIFLTVADREAELYRGRGDPWPAPGERLQVLHIPGTADVEFAGRWPYRDTLPAVLLTAVLGAFAIAPNPGKRRRRPA
ncbi:hypothetical protein ACQP00_27555 [Dactylosporangium sp. CS-047395]|uniref:hypothetical protein n=1 Tax=Dactylosporangium sp. CS-047395 TaxID=3239936 RepID=UPI003D8A9485